MKKPYIPKRTGNFRYRKKYHLGEFSHYGFELKALNPKIPMNDSLADSFISFIESLHLYCGGSITSLGLELIIESGTYKWYPKQEHKDKIKEWLSQYFDTIEFSNYINLYYPERKVEKTLNA